MKKISNLELEKLTENLICDINKDNFNPDFIIKTGYSADYLALKFSKHFSGNIIKLRGRRCNSNNKFLLLSYFLARKSKRIMSKINKSGNNYFFNTLRNIVLSIYKKNYPVIENTVYNNYLLEKFNKESKILILDDHAYTGRTIESTINFLISKDFKRENIKSCVLSSSNGYKPDYYATQEALSFPWNPIGV